MILGLLEPAGDQPRWLAGIAAVAQETSFEAELGPLRPGPRAKWVKLFRKAAASGEKTMVIRGRHTVDVNFGDYPYVVRFSPWRE